MSLSALTISGTEIAIPDRGQDACNNCSCAIFNAIGDALASNDISATAGDIFDCFDKHNPGVIRSDCLYYNKAGRPGNDSYQGSIKELAPAVRKELDACLSPNGKKALQAPAESTCPLLAEDMEKTVKTIASTPVCGEYFWPHQLTHECGIQP